MGKSRLIRHRMLYIVLLGVLTSAVSLIALERALGLTDAQREGRARDVVMSELGRLAKLPATAESLGQPPVSTYVGLRAGWLASEPSAETLEAAPAAWRPTILAALRAPGMHEAQLGSSKLLVAAQRVSSGAVWVGMLVLPSAYLQPWRWIVYVLALATALLVATALRWAWLFRKNTAALHATLVGLGKEPATPLATPSMSELAIIADGIRALDADLRRARAAQEQLARELAHKERLAALGRVAAGVAHEVRNPLASIKLRLDLTAASLPAASRAELVAASEEITRLDRLVSDLLVVAGNKSGPQKPVELAALARARAQALAPWAETRGVEICVDGEGRALADPESLARALDNLLRNAVEASPPEGRVDVAIAHSEGHIEVRVDDSGAGVCQEECLFEPFFTTKSDGTGLGLAISRAIARAHGGELTYARAGARTRFALSLPEVT